MIGMSKTKNLDELRAARIELEDTSQAEESTASESRKIAIQELENNNEAARKSVARLKSEVKTLENKLNQTPRD